MEKIFNQTSVIMGLAGGFIARLFGGWDLLLYTLVVLMAMDYVSGIIKGVYTRQLSSEIGWKGLLKKGVTLIVVALASVLENLLGHQSGLREIVIMFFAANEGISILENAAVLLPQMPQRIKDVLLQLRGSGKGDSSE